MSDLPLARVLMAATEARADGLDPQAAALVTAAYALAEMRLLRSSKQSAAMAQASVGAMLIAEASTGRLLGWTPEAIGLLGLSQDAPSSIDELHRWPLFYVDGSFCPVEDRPFTRALRDGAVTELQRIVFRDGAGRHVQASLSTTPVYDKAGAISGALQAVTDLILR